MSRNSNETRAHSFVEIVRSPAWQLREVDLIMNRLTGIPREEVIAVYQKNQRDITKTILELRMRPEIEEARQRTAVRRISVVEIRQEIAAREARLTELQGRFPNIGPAVIEEAYRGNRGDLVDTITAAREARRVRLAELQGRFPNIGPAVIEEAYRENRGDLIDTVTELQMYRRVRFASPLTQSYPWLSRSQIEDVSRLDNSLERIQTRLSLLTHLKVAEGIPDVTSEEVQAASHGATTIDQIIDKIRLTRETIGQYTRISSSGLIGLPRPGRRTIQNDGMMESQRKMVMKKEHPNNKYCPDLFDLLAWIERDRSRVDDIFPGQTYDRFMIEPTFFPTAAVPDDWEDLYGEPASNRVDVYAFVEPGNPDSMRFYSSEELISSFTQASNFIDPGSRTNEHFNERQITRLLALIEGDDSVLESIIHEIRLVREESIQEMTEMSTIEGFRDCLDHVLKVGMLMRGWSGEGDYPLLEEETRNPIDEVKLTDGLMELQKRLEADWAPFKQLRLMKEREPSWRLSDQTLWERLIIVLDAGQDDSCIRMTSTLYVMTAWFCLDRFFSDRSFDLDRLEEIF